jgi:zinc-ribbon domain
MVKFCKSCGTANIPDARYCAKCGAAIAETVAEAPSSPDAIIPSPEHAELPDPDSLTSPSQNPVQSHSRPKAIAPWKVAAIATAALIVIGILYFWLFLADDLGSARSPQDPAVADDAAEYAATRQLFAVTEVNIRDKPSTKEGAIIGKLPRGSAVTGTLKMGMDGTSSWFELADGKGYIADINLTEAAPPEITKLLNDKIWEADSPIDIWQVAGPADTLLDRVSAGTKLTLVGLTANDFIEVKMPKGGVGYIADGAAILARLGGRPIAITFNPQTCSFGNELGAEFTKIGARLKAQWQALEDREFTDDEAREKAYNAAEGKSSYVRIARSFEGLSLTAIAQHYESQSLYFADPPAKVIEVFRNNGFRIDGNGNFASTELYAGISATRGEGASFGKTELGCGV